MAISYSHASRLYTRWRPNQPNYIAVYVSLEAMFVWRWFADGKLTVAYANMLHDKVALQVERFSH